MNETCGPVMTVEGLAYAYWRGEPVLQGISETVHRGCLHALIGPNASGKTTLLKLLAGLMTPTAGRITMDQRPLDRLGLRERAKWLSYVPSGSTLTFTFTVGHVVSMGRFVLPWRAEDFARIVRACQIDDLLDRPYVQLSAGQQQRVLLARALYQSAGEGRVMLLDEPTSAMDMEHVHRAMRLLGEQRRAGLAVVAIVHDLNLAAEYADRVWLLDGGRLAASGTWDQVLQPERLEPVYHTPIRRLDGRLSGRKRPVFLAELPDSPPSRYN